MRKAEVDGLPERVHAPAEIDGGKVVTHLARVVADVARMTEPEMAETVDTPALEEAVCEERAGVARAGEHRVDVERVVADRRRARRAGRASVSPIRGSVPIGADLELPAARKHGSGPCHHEQARRLHCERAYQPGNG